MAIAETKQTSTKPIKKAIPRLENGDQLTRIEFERRYEAMPNLKKAELIEGVVYVPSPTRHVEHGSPHMAITTWLGVYHSATPGVEASNNTTVRLDLDNEPQPDAVLMILSEAGGQSRIDADGFIDGAPELVAEVAASSVSYDLGPKLNVYRRHGVREYVVWRVLDEAIDWFVLRDGRFDPLTADTAGIYRSEAFPGLWLDAPALLAGDVQKVLKLLGDGLASPEHGAFVDRLKQAAATK